MNDHLQLRIQLLVVSTPEEEERDNLDVFL